MTIAELLSTLDKLDVRVILDGDRLRVNAPKGVLTDPFRRQLADRKTEIVEFLRAQGPAAEVRYPLSPQQRRVWLLDGMEPGTAVHTIALLGAMGGVLEPALIEEVLGRLAQRHETLRTVIAERDGEPQQIVRPAGSVPLETVDLAAVPAADRDEEVMRRARRLAAQPFDLGGGPLVRAALLSLGAGEHRLLLVAHRIVADESSLRLLWGEARHALQSGAADSLGTPVPRYGVIVLRDTERLQGEALESRRRYWRERFPGPIPVIEVPGDRARPRQPASAAKTHVFQVAAPVKPGLQGRDGLRVALLAAFVALLHRYTGETHVTVGAFAANRDDPARRAAVGPLADLLPLAVDLTDDPSFRTLLDRVGDALRSAVDHALPFGQIVDELQPGHTVSHAPLVQACVVLDVEPADPDAAPLALSTPFDLTVGFAERAEGSIEVRLDYRVDLFDATTVARLARHYGALLAAATQDADRAVSALALLDSDEVRQLVVESNATTTAYPRDRSIHQLFAETAASRPTGIALVFGETTVDYRDLDRRSSRLANHLIARGVQPEQLVGIWMERSIEMVVAVLAVVKAGAAYAPFDLAAPPERVAFMLSDGQIGVVLSQEHMAERLPPSGVQVIRVDAEWPAIEREPDVAPAVGNDPEQLAYVMYTSGSTGEPKGVAVTHRNVVRLVRDTDYARFGAGEVFLLLAPLSFDASTFEIWGSLLNGGCLVVAPPGVPSVSELAALLAHRGVTTLWLTAGLFHQVVDADVHALRGLRQLLAGGDVLSVAHVRRVLAELPGCRVINGYGPTEGTTFTCCHAVTEASVGLRSIPIGRPVANTRVFVLDRHRRPVPIGVPGELWIGGDGLARGYFNRPDLTAERFVTHRLDDGRTERLYRSGDVVRYLPDGDLEFIGRADSQVKLRGFRIELGEIEATLARHPAIRDVVVVVRGEGVDRCLVAYVVLDGAVSATDLGRFVGDRLPRYMVPAAFVTLEALPLTSNGKVDRRRLPAPPVEVSRREAPVRPRDDLERQLVPIWEECLGVDSVGIHDDFFELGGHSLLAVRLFANLEKVLGRKIPVAVLFQAPTVAQLADLIRQGGWERSWQAIVPIQPSGRRAPIFAVPGVDGNVLGLRRLSQLLGDDQPFYGLQSRGLDGRERPLSRIDDIAAHFVREVRELRPQGPYLLLGVCMGGVVAFEMAQQLRAAGQEVRFLGLLDTWPPVSLPARPSRLRAYPVFNFLYFVAGRVTLYRRTMALMTRKEALRFVVSRLRMVREMIAQRDPFRGNASEFHGARVTQANLVAFKAYRPRPYPGPAFLFRAEERPVVQVADLRLVWRGLTSGLEIINVPGEDTGLALREPHVRVLAQRLGACLDAVLDPVQNPSRR